MGVPIPLSGWADSELLACGVPAIAALSGSMLMGERAAHGGYAIPGRTSAGGSCHLYATRDGHVALNLARPDDQELLPALFGDAEVSDVAARFTHEDSAVIVARGRMLGLAIAAIDEAPAGPACAIACEGLPAPLSPRPRVIDLSALWAGPLASSLLGLAGAEVIKVENPARPDSMRTGDAALFARLNDRKASISLDLQSQEGRDRLIDLIRRARIIIEASRPRALSQLGIDSAALVREIPGLIWVSITGHGICGDAANWIGFGDDCGVAGGLSAALRDATGSIGFVGDACADPLTGIHAARVALAQHRSGVGAHLILSMSGVVAKACAVEKQRNPGEFNGALLQWAHAVGRPFPTFEPRRPC